MRMLLNNQWIQLAVRLLIGGVFLYAGWLKVRAAQPFADSIAAYRMLPASLIGVLALALPPAEIIVGILLITGIKKSVASFTAFLMCLVFALALSLAIARGIVVDCGCFGAGKPSMTKMWLSLGRDLLLIGGAGLIYLKSCFDERWRHVV